ncbi:MAG: histidinol phosphate phosphatase domain-containing protein [bacterium]
MIDLHTHTFLSDGALLPTELIRRAAVMGHKAVALTDHVDASNVEMVVPGTVKACLAVDKNWGIRAVPGAEITHAAPEQIAGLTARIRELGGQIVVVHGETIVEPVAPGTNRAALEAGVDILAHPGLITEEEVALAVKQGVALEISGRKGHSLTNGWVAQAALSASARLVINSDAHGPGDLFNRETAEKILWGAGVSRSDREAVFNNSERIISEIK